MAVMFRNVQQMSQLLSGGGAWWLLCELAVGGCEIAICLTIVCARRVNITLAPSHQKYMLPLLNSSCTSKITHLAYYTICNHMSTSVCYLAG